MWKTSLFGKLKTTLLASSNINCTNKEEIQMVLFYGFAVFGFLPLKMEL